MAKKKKITDNAVKILHKRFVKGKQARLNALQVEREKTDIAEKVYQLRVDAGLTQKQLADKVGTTQSVISRLEDADYTGHTLSMLDRIAAALNYRVEVRFVPAKAG